MAYGGSVCAELDRKWDEYKRDLCGSVVQVDVTGRIGSTGTEEKASNAHTGAVFDIDFEKMVQRNIKSAFERPIKREPL